MVFKAGKKKPSIAESTGLDEAVQTFQGAIKRFEEVSDRQLEAINKLVESLEKERSESSEKTKKDEHNMDLFKEKIVRDEIRVDRLIDMMEETRK